MTAPTTITELRTTLLRLPWAGPPPATGFLPTPHRELLVLEVETADGQTGMGYLMPLSGGLETIDTCLRELIAPKVIGRDSTEIEGIWQSLWRSTYVLGRMGVTVFAQSALDIALWDLLGKRAGLPLYRLWGATKADVPAYGSGCWRGLGKDGMIQKAQAFVERGLKAIKMQVAHLRPWREDVMNVRAMRAALGPNIEIMVDVNEGWTADTAIQAGQYLDECDIYWLEEPVVCEDFAGYARIAQALKTRVVGGENHFTRFDLRPFFTTPNVPILQPDPMRGGLTELRKIAATADTFGITIAPHLFHELMVHLMASIPNANYLEYMDWIDDLWVEPVLPVEGRMRPLEHPGHGLRFRPEALKDHRIGGSRMKG
jgi:L-alanine-DL-glutamate epimerase-like enolase superfamily enzyme